MNERDSEIIEQLLGQKGYLTVAKPDQADLVVLNTCSIRAKAEQKVFSLLGQLRPLKKDHPDMRIAVVGCVAQQEGKRIFNRMNHVDIVCGTQQIYKLPDMINRLENGLSKYEFATDLKPDFTIPSTHKLFIKSKTIPHLSSQQPAKKFVNIMQGCNNYCSYCIVPSTRGREISRSVSDIVTEVNILVAQGVKEITLLGQNVNSYGKTNRVDELQTDFADLLYKVAEIKGLQRLRFTTSHPKDLSNKLMRCYAELDVLCPHFHLPVQSGSDSVLKRMNRKYTIKSYLDKIETLLSFRPDITLATDIIVGFPGETEDDFEMTMDLLETVRFHSSFSFKYSDRPGTPSSKFDNKVSEDVKSFRLNRFQERQNQITLERNREYLGLTMQVMVENIKEKKAQGRTPTNHIVHFNVDQLPEIGDIVPILIKGAGKHSLRGVIHKLH